MYGVGEVGELDGVEDVLLLLEVLGIDGVGVGAADHGVEVGVLYLQCANVMSVLASAFNVHWTWSDHARTGTRFGRCFVVLVVCHVR